MEKAEAAYLKLTEREPENENYRGLLNAVQQKLGREIKPVEFSTQEMALAAEEELPPEPAAVDANQEAMVKEALENSDLFARYNLTEKAIAELEKVLQIYPDQIDVHRRILEISRKGFPERGAVAAAQLARIFTEHGDHRDRRANTRPSRRQKAPCRRFRCLRLLPARKWKSLRRLHRPRSETPEAGKTMEFPIPAIAPEEPVAAAAPAPPPEEISFDLTPPEAPSEPPAPPPATSRAGRTDNGVGSLRRPGGHGGVWF